MRLLLLIMFPAAKGIQEIIIILLLQLVEMPLVKAAKFSGLQEKLCSHLLTFQCNFYCLKSPLCLSSGSDWLGVFINSCFVLIDLPNISVKQFFIEFENETNQNKVIQLIHIIEILLVLSLKCFMKALSYNLMLSNERVLSSQRYLLVDL